MNLFVKAWKGQASLAAAFWVVYFIVTIILYFIVVYLALAIRPALMHSPKFPYIVSLILLPYILYSAISVWRCAKNSNMVWAVLARIIMVLAVLGALFSVAHLFM